MFGAPNRTANEYGKEADYRAALPDLEAALAWPSTQGLPAKAIVWGSSYSAALVFLLAAKHPDAIAALLAFSPGEYLGDTHSVKDAAAKIHAPVFVDSALDNEEIDAARTIVRAVPGSSAVQFVPKRGGVHGSSTLRTDRNSKGAEENWQAVEKFLTGLA
jgi:dienelactone hydrolase